MQCCLNLLLFVSVLLFSSSAAAQKVAVTNMKKNFLVYGETSTLQIVVENTACRAISVSTKDGKLVKKGPCYYSFTPNKVGLTQIVVRNGKGLNYAYLTRVEAPPVPVELPKEYRLYFAKEIKKNIAISYLKSQPGLFVVTLNRKKNTARVKRFSYMITRAGDYIQGATINGRKYDDRFRKGLLQAKKGDKILFYDLKVIDEGVYYDASIPPIEFNLM